MCGRRRAAGRRGHCAGVFATFRLRSRKPLTGMTARDDVVRKAKHEEQDLEKWKERGVMLRVFVYVFATHLFAGFVWILFYVGEHAQK